MKITFWWRNADVKRAMYDNNTWYPRTRMPGMFLCPDEHHRDWQPETKVLNEIVWNSNTVNMSRGLSFWLSYQLMELNIVSKLKTSVQLLNYLVQQPRDELNYIGLKASISDLKIAMIRVSYQLEIFYFFTSYVWNWVSWEVSFQTLCVAQSGLKEMRNTFSFCSCEMKGWRRMEHHRWLQGSKNEDRFQPEYSFNYIHPAAFTN